MNYHYYADFKPLFGCIPELTAILTYGQKDFFTLFYKRFILYSHTLGRVHEYNTVLVEELDSPRLFSKILRKWREIVTAGKIKKNVKAPYLVNFLQNCSLILEFNSLRSQ